MKTTLISILTATLLGFASYATDRQFGIAEFLAVVFTVGLVGWTVEQYSREPRSLTKARPIHLPISPEVRPEAARADRLAA
jgi:hypothetical protein